MLFNKTTKRVANDVYSLIEFQIVQDLGSYLGMPLFHGRVTKGTLRLLVDKVKSRLNGYKVHLLSLDSRVTPTKSILLAIPNYFMLTMLVSIGVCRDIEVVRNFV